MPKKSRDPDQEYLVGCAISGLIGFIVLATPVAICMIDAYGPKTIYTPQGLQRLFITSAPLALVIGVVGSWFGRIAGIFGTLGGFACGAAFWFMHIQQTIAKAPSEIGKFPDYSDSTMWLVPLAWLAIGAIASLPFLLRKQKPVNS